MLASEDSERRAGELGSLQMKRLGVVLMATVGFAAMAQAADLPTKKETAPAPAKPDCWSSVWNWLNASASDCPIGAYGITLYGTLDVGYGYQEWGTNRDPSSDKLNYGLNKSGHEHIWQPTFNALSTSVLGLRMKEDLSQWAPGWSLIGVLEAGFNPYSGMLINGPRALSDNNVNNAAGITTVTIAGKKYTIYNSWQSTNFDSSRAGQWDNSQGYVGFSHKTWGDLTFGRTNSLASDSLSKYDPVASTAFSQIGFSGSFPGFGLTEITRINTALTYKVAIPKVWALDTVRLAGQAQIGGYGVGNAATSHYEVQGGLDWGAFSFDGIFGWAQNAVSLSNYGGSVTACGAGNVGISQSYGIWPGSGCYNANDILKASLSNTWGMELMGSYKWDRFRFYGGYIYANNSNPSDGFEGGLKTIANGIFAPPGAVTSTDYPKVNGAGVITSLNSPNYSTNKVLQTLWTGFRYAVPDDWMRGWGALDFAVGFYYQWQNDFNFSWNTGTINGVSYGYASGNACTGAGAFISSSKCAGSIDTISFFADWKPVKRVDIYAGVMIQNVYGGLANGYYNNQVYINPVNGQVVTTQHAFTQNYDPTIGIRIRF